MQGFRPFKLRLAYTAFPKAYYFPVGAKQPVLTSNIATGHSHITHTVTLFFKNDFSNDHPYHTLCNPYLWQKILTWEAFSHHLTHVVSQHYFKAARWTYHWCGSPVPLVLRWPYHHGVCKKIQQNTQRNTLTLRSYAGSKVFFIRLTNNFLSLSYNTNTNNHKRAFFSFLNTSEQKNPGYFPPPTLLGLVPPFGDLKDTSKGFCASLNVMGGTFCTQIPAPTFHLFENTCPNTSFIIIILPFVFNPLAKYSLSANFFHST